MNNRPEKFPSIAHRVLWGYRFSFTEFTPINTSDISLEDQERLYKIMDAVLTVLENNPDIINLPLDTDQAYPWGVCNNGNPELNKLFVDCCGKLYDFYNFLYIAGKYGHHSETGWVIEKAELKAQKAVYKPVYAELLAKTGVSCTANREAVTLNYEYPETFTALQYIAENGIIGDLVRCSFDGNADYMIDRIDKLYDYRGMLTETVERFRNKGYEISVCFNIEKRAVDLSIRCSASDNVCFVCGYNVRKKQMFFFGTGSGIGEKAMLADFNNLPPIVQRHMIDICRPCTYCMECTKGGRNQPFTVNLDYQGTEYIVCPRFPNHEWEFLTPELAERLEAYLDTFILYQK